MKRSKRLIFQNIILVAIILSFENSNQLKSQDFDTGNLSFENLHQSSQSRAPASESSSASDEMTDMLNILLPVLTNQTPQVNIYATDPIYLHKIGRRYDSQWGATTQDREGYLSYGPYLTGIPVGVSTATFSLAIDNRSASNVPVALLDVRDANAGTLLARRLIKRQDFSAAGTAQDFDLVFETTAATRLEFRVYSYGAAFLQHFGTVIRPDHYDLKTLWMANLISNKSSTINSQAKRIPPRW